jgi:hypothetical protein
MTHGEMKVVEACEVVYSFMAPCVIVSNYRRFGESVTLVVRVEVVK